jgi:hypothetical protein
MNANTSLKMSPLAADGGTTTAYQLFLDLDGVLVDFDAGIVDILGRPPDGGPHGKPIPPGLMWSTAARADSFYEHLCWMPDGRVLWEFARALNPVILSGLPRGNWAAPQKRAWCERELGQDVQVELCMSRDKPERAQALTPEGLRPVLVDDRASLAEPFEQAGGVFVLHRSAAESIERLKQLFPRPPQL